MRCDTIPSRCSFGMRRDGSHIMASSSGYRRLPSVDRILSHQQVRDLIALYQRQAVVGLVQRQMEESRQAIANGVPPPTLDTIADTVVKRARAEWQTGPRRVINAAGVILHTNLGRAPLSAEATRALLEVATGYTNLEFDLTEGTRGSRHAHAVSLLCQLTGAEASLVVNNNASAVMLGLAALTAGKEVIVSRGEAVEIGGGFRIPDVMAQSGATLQEVGTTNRTYVSDYEQAISENTAALLKVHASNFRISGFTHTPTAEELVAMGTRHGIPVLHDLGSGCLLETTRFGLAHEPMPHESIAAGCALAFFSGDKLLGGPQAGIVVGQREHVQRLERHPLARALRIDKLSLAALTATLLHYLKGEATDKIPAWRMIAVPAQEMKSRAQRWKRTLGARATLIQGLSTMGGGSLPGETLPTWLLALSDDGLHGGAEALAQRLRDGDPPIIGRIEDDRLLLDPRTVLPEEDEPLVQGVREAVDG